MNRREFLKNAAASAVVMALAQTGVKPESPQQDEWFIELEGHSCRIPVYISRGRCINPEQIITYTDCELVSCDEETGAMTFKYGEATNEPA